MKKYSISYTDMDRAQWEALPVLAKRLRLALEKSRLTAQELAGKTSISASTIGAYLDGRQEPKASNLKLLAGTFQVSTDWLLGLSDNWVPDDGVKFICEETGLSSEAVAKLRAYQSSGDALDRCLLEVSSFLLERRSGIGGIAYQLLLRKKNLREMEAVLKCLQSLSLPSPEAEEAIAHFRTLALQEDLCAYQLAKSAGHLSDAFVEEEYTAYRAAREVLSHRPDVGGELALQLWATDLRKELETF